MAVCQNLVPLVNIKIAGKWMFIPLRMVLIGIDPYQNDSMIGKCSHVHHGYSAILKNSVGFPFDSHVQNPAPPRPPRPVPFAFRIAKGPEVSAAAVLPERTCPVIVRAIMLILVAWRSGGDEMIYPLVN